MIDQTNGISISHDLDKKEDFAFLFVNITLLITWVFAPLLSSVFICIFIGTCRLPRPTFLFYLFLLALIPALVNSTKVPVSDLEEYNRVFNLFYRVGIGAVSAESILDPIFYYTTWILAHISGGFTPVLILFWSTCTYLILFLALSELNDLFKATNKSRLAGLVFFTLFIGVEFGLTGHLVRQCFALSVVMLGLARFISGKNYKLIFLIAFLSHLSTLIFLPVLLLVNLERKKRAIIVIVMLIAAILIGQTNLLEFAAFLPGMNNQFASAITQKASDYVAKNDGDITIRMLAEVIFYLIVAVYLTIYGTKTFSARTNIAVRKYALCFVVFTIFVLFIRNNSLLLLRYFFYFQYLTLFLLLVISQYKKLVFYALFCVLVITAPYRYFGLLKVSQYTYISNSYPLLFLSVPQIITHWE